MSLKRKEMRKSTKQLLDELQSFGEDLEDEPALHQTRQQRSTQTQKKSKLKDMYPPTGYNSLEGYKIFEGVKYYHGELDPYGNKVHAPILSDEEFAKEYEMFPVKVKVWNEKRQKYDVETEYPPVKLNKIDLKICDLLNQHEQVVILAYRDARKSSNLQRKIKRCILDLHLSVAYFGDNANHAKKFSQKIRYEFMKNPNILRDYGYVIDDEQGNSKEEVFFYWQGEGQESSRDPGLMIGSLEGMGQTGGHPDVIALDDVINEKTKGSERKVDLAIDWFTMQVAPMARGHTLIYIVGTMKDKRDLYNYLEQTDMYAVEKIPAIIQWPNGNQTTPGTKDNVEGRWWYHYTKQPKDKKPMITGVMNLHGGLVSFDEYDQENWSKPGRIQYYIDGLQRNGIDKNLMAMQEFLLRRQISIDAFESEFQMNAVRLSNKSLNFDKIKLFNPYTVHAHAHLKANVCAFFDQAYGETNYADFNCIAVVAEYDEEYFILDIDIWRNDADNPMNAGVSGKIRHIEAIFRRFPYISELGIEMGQSNNSEGNQIFRYFENNDHINVTQKWQLRLGTKANNEEEESASTAMMDFSDVNVKDTKRKKVIRIYNQWTDKLQNERIYMQEGINQEAMDEFFEEKSDFPTCKHYDILDALGSAFDMCAEGDSQCLDSLEVGHSVGFF